MYSDEFYMQRCLDLAENALGKTYPNPIVGCVIVHEGKIIGEGWHKKHMMLMQKLMQLIL